MYVCACLCACLCARLCARVCMLGGVVVRARACVRVRASVCAGCACVYVYMRVRVCMHVYVCMHACVRVYACMCTCVFMHVYVCMQIDFILTNYHGRSMVSKFGIVKLNWHHSDHLPLDLAIKVCSTINTKALHVRSTQLILHDTFYVPSSLKNFNDKKFNYEQAKCILPQKAHYIYEETSFATTPDVILEIIYKQVDPVLKKTYIKENVASLSNTSTSTECDELFIECFKGNCTLQMSNRFFIILFHRQIVVKKP